MRISQGLIALLLCSAAAHAQPVQPLIDRPLTLSDRKIDLTLQGTYTNWAGSTVPSGTSVDGESVAIGVDFGASDRVQPGFAVAFPINPGAGFGSVLGSVAFLAARGLALRLDAGYERTGVNGATTGSAHSNRYFGGIGVPIKLPISSTVAFLSGRVGAVQFGHFNNLGASGIGVYSGASTYAQTSADLFSVSVDGFTNVSINLPAGLLFQPDPHVALTLLAGYSAQIEFLGSTTVVLHYFPTGLEAVFTPSPPFDIGARLFFDGYVTSSNGTAPIGYFDMRGLMLWLRVRA